MTLKDRIAEIVARLHKDACVSTRANPNICLDEDNGRKWICDRATYLILTAVLEEVPENPFPKEFNGMESITYWAFERCRQELMRRLK